jgi:hypothetical protein
VALCVAAYGVSCLLHPERFGLLDAVDLPIHETGHLLFSPFGAFLQFLGGTLLQLAFPLVFVLYFLRRRDRYAAHIVSVWVAQNLWNVSVYVADARARRLPLVGGGEHDWAYLLGRLGLLEHDLRLSAIVHGAGVLLFTWAVWGALVHAGDVAIPASVSPAAVAPGNDGACVAADHPPS